MSDDIRPGDVVVCIDESPCGCCGEHLPICIGQMFRVERVALATNNRTRALFVALFWDGFPGFANHLPNGGVAAARFRKLPAADPEFTAQMRALKPRQRSKQEA